MSEQQKLDHIQHNSMRAFQSQIVGRRSCKANPVNSQSFLQPRSSPVALIWSDFSVISSPIAESPGASDDAINI